MGPEPAASRPLPGGHTIAEIVRHVTAWETIVRRRLEGEAVGDVPVSEDWPTPRPGPDGWQAARDALHQAHRRLGEAVGALGDERLDEKVPGETYSVYVMLHGAVQHALYHAGQIALLKKAVRPTGSA